MIKVVAEVILEVLILKNGFQELLLVLAELLEELLDVVFLSSERLELVTDIVAELRALADLFLIFIFVWVVILDGGRVLSII